MRGEAETWTNRRGAQALRKATADNVSVERRRTPHRRKGSNGTRTSSCCICGSDACGGPPYATRPSKDGTLGEGVPLKQAVVT